MQNVRARRSGWVRIPSREASAGCVICDWPVTEHTMSHLPEDSFSAADEVDRLASLAQGRAQEALRAGRDYAQANPIPVVLGALVIGVAVGMLCGRREPKPRDAAQIARDLVEDAFAQLADRLPTKKQLEACPDAVRSQFANLGRKLRWW